MDIEVLYFASVRESRGADSDILTLAEDATVEDLLAELRGGALSMLDERLASSLLVAINQSMAGVKDVIRQGDELAIFPPMTGG